MEQLSMHQDGKRRELGNLRNLVEMGQIMKNARIGDILVAARFVTREQIEAAIGSKSREKAQRIGELLLEQCLISEDQLLAALSIRFRMTFVDLDTVVPDPEALQTVPKELVNLLQVFPFAKSGKKLTVATSQPTDPTVFDRVRFSTNCTVDLVAARAQQIAAKIDRYYNQEEVVDRLICELRDEQLTIVEEPVETAEVEPDSKVIRLVNRLLMDAQRLGASDIHFESGHRKAPLKVRYRVDGECFVAHEIPASYNSAVIARLKIISNLDIAEHRKPQSGKIILKSNDGKESMEMECRVEITPTVDRREDAVLRVLSRSKPLPLEKMEFSPSNHGAFREMLDRPHGMILCVGPTGSGKTTTLHSALSCLNLPQKKIWTAEDPVEIVQEGLRQVQVNPRIGFNFQDALKSFMRADPDVIMIGEIRDTETAKTAIAAALSGHLVFSTLHTNSAVETVIRLVEMGMEPYLFADALIGVLAQRLARRLCDACKEPYHPSREEYRKLEQGFAAESIDGIPTYSEGLTLMRKKGCEKCLDSGYKGRIAIHELMPVVPELKEAIKQRANVETLRKLALQNGMETLMMDGVRKILQGITDLEQVTKVCLQ